LTWLYFIAPVGLLVIGFPIYQVLLITGIVLALFVQNVDATQIHTQLFGGLDQNALLAIPFFILAGEIMGRGGIAKRIVDWVLSLLGRIPGSLALSTIASSELFGAMSGSSIGCVAAIGRLLYPSLRANGYDERFAAGLITSSGAVAIVIPPSIAMIIYGVVAQQSIPQLFLAGFLPGILIGLCAAIYVLYYSHRHQLSVPTPLRWSNVVRATRAASWALGAPALIFGGIYGGAFTPTEAAGIVVVYAALVSLFVYRDIDWRGLGQIAWHTAYLCGQILIIVAAANVYSNLLTTSGLPAALVDVIKGWRLDAWSLLLLFNVGLLLIGSFLEPPAAILIVTPLVLPVVTALGINPVHFGIVVTINLSIGMYTPPFGLNIFAMHALFDVPISTLYRGVLPFLVFNLVALAIVTYVPWISLVLPSLLR
jgi:C4-dicarboxylate transporter DctM subunit